MWRGIRTQVAREHKVPGSADARVPQRRAAVRWRWWFPASRNGSAAFGTLQCVRPTGAGPADRWHPVRLLEPADLRPPADITCDAAVANCAALLGVPQWLRDRQPATDFEQVMLRRAGITTPPKLKFFDPRTMRRTHEVPVGSRPPGRPKKPG